MVYTKKDYTNNIFNWATKELSQDAVIAWILCSSNGKEFLKNLTSRPLLGTGPSLPEEYEIEAVYAQDSKAPSAKMDVFVELKGHDGKLYAVIIEDKTDSWLHDQQLAKYVHSACIATREKSKERKYTGIFFIVVKTGSYYFWEHEQYIAEAKATQENAELPSWLFIKDKKTFRERCTAIIDSKIPISFFYYLYDDFNSFVKTLCTSSAWMQDYKEYLLSIKPSQTWMTNLGNSVDSLVKHIASESVDTQWPFTIRRPNGGGLKTYNIEILLGGEDVIKKRNTTAPIKQRLCLLIYIELTEADSTKVGMNCHLFTNDSDPAGYCPSAKLGLTPSQEQEYQNYRICFQTAIKDRFESRSFNCEIKWKEIKTIRDLQICTVKCKGGNYFENNELAEITQKLVEATKEVLDNTDSYDVPEKPFLHT